MCECDIDIVVYKVDVSVKQRSHRFGLYFRIPLRMKLKDRKREEEYHKRALNLFYSKLRSDF